jgi:hypothetical protein
MSSLDIDVSNDPNDVSGDDKEIDYEAYIRTFLLPICNTSSLVLPPYPEQTEMEEERQASTFGAIAPVYRTPSPELLDLDEWTRRKRNREPSVVSNASDDAPLSPPKRRSTQGVLADAVEPEETEVAPNSPCEPVRESQPREETPMFSLLGFFDEWESEERAKTQERAQQMQDVAAADDSASDDEDFEDVLSSPGDPILRESSPPETSPPVALLGLGEWWEDEQRAKKRAQQVRDISASVNGELILPSSLPHTSNWSRDFEVCNEHQCFTFDTRHPLGYCGDTRLTIDGENYINALHYLLLEACTRIGLPEYANQLRAADTGAGVRRIAFALCDEQRLESGQREELAACETLGGVRQFLRKNGKKFSISRMKTHAALAKCCSHLSMVSEVRRFLQASKSLCLAMCGPEDPLRLASGSAMYYQDCKLHHRQEVEYVSPWITQLNRKRDPMHAPEFIMHSGLSYVSDSSEIDALSDD